MDAWRVLMGTRLLQQIIISLAFRLLLPLAVMTTAAVLYIQSDVAAMCQTEGGLAGAQALSCPGLMWRAVLRLTATTTTPSSSCWRTP